MKSPRCNAELEANFYAALSPCCAAKWHAKWLGIGMDIFECSACGKSMREILKTQEKSA